MEKEHQLIVCFAFLFLKNIFEFYLEPTKPDTIKTRKRKGSQDSGGGRSETGSEDSSTNLPRSICTKRQRKIFQARKPMFDLWANRPVNLFAEKTHNSRCGKLFPHCCVCQYFVSKEIWNSLPPVETLPKRFFNYYGLFLGLKALNICKVFLIIRI